MSRPAKTKLKHEQQEKILASHFIKNREEFSVADIAQWLGIHHAIAARYLNELADGAQIARRVADAEYVKISGHGPHGTHVYSRKPTAFARMRIRKHTDEQLGIVT